MKQELYNRRWNLLFFGENEEHNENCKEKVKKIISEKLQIRNVDSMKFCGVHRVGQKRFAQRRNRPIICRLTCRKDREHVYKAKAKLHQNKNYATAIYKIRSLFLLSTQFSQISLLVQLLNPRGISHSK